MPCRYIIDKEKHLVISSAWGRLTFPEANAHEDQLVSDPDFDPSFDQLIDLTDLAVFGLSVGEAKTIAGRNFFSARSRRALVTSNPSIFGMLRLMEAYHSIAGAREQVRSFYTRASALQWLRHEDDLTRRG
ncbi:MAG TPA: hypothetical protein VE377_16250 [Candidatus Dormibacteraeota bacterium]|nr:hypothetical protein [Candidatus Dormibacteraeota bacterium]